MYVGAILVTVIVYVFVVLPSAAVTSTEIVFEPTFKVISLLAVPLATATLFTLTVAPASASVGVTFTLVTSCATLAV